MRLVFNTGNNFFFIRRITVKYLANMKIKNYKVFINTALILWLFIWVYYLAFNWSVFSVELKTNLGFAVISSYPFLFFFLTGLILFIILKYAYHIVSIQEQNQVKDKETKTSLLEKDIEILKLKEVLFKMQTKDMNDSSSALAALQDKLDKISDKITETDSAKSIDPKDLENKEDNDRK